MEVAKILKQGTLALTSHTAHRSAAVTTEVVVLGVHASKPTEAEVIRVVAIVNHRRPVVAASANEARRTVPDPAIHEIHWRVLDVAGSAASEAESCN